MKALMKEGLSSMENLKTQTVKHKYIVKLTCSTPFNRICRAGYSPNTIIYMPVTESVSAALKETAQCCKSFGEPGTYDVSVCLETARDEELYANTMVAPDACTFLRKCAEDAAMPR